MWMLPLYLHVNQKSDYDMKSYSHFFSKNINVYAIFNDQSFNEALTNDIVSFEQLSPGGKHASSEATVTHIHVPTSKTANDEFSSSQSFHKK